LRFLEDTPTSTNIFTIKYGIPHTFSDSDNTLPTSDARAFCHLVASKVAYAISAKFAQHQDSSIGADAVDYGGKQSLWADVAKDQRGMYNDFFGLSDDGGDGATSAPAAGLFADTDFALAHGRPFLTHDSRYR
jgi:hypothetical protein